MIFSLTVAATLVNIGLICRSTIPTYHFPSRSGNDKFDPMPKEVWILRLLLPEPLPTIISQPHIPFNAN
jgi:hypothetical protein